MDWVEFQGLCQRLFNPKSVQIIILVYILVLPAFAQPPRTVRWGRSFRQPLFRGDLALCQWSSCISETWSAKVHGCVKSGEYLRGNPRSCDNGGGNQYLCCKYSAGSTVGIKPAERKPIGGAQDSATTLSPIPANLPPLLAAKFHFMTKLEQEIIKVNNWLLKKKRLWQSKKTGRKYWKS